MKPNLITKGARTACLSLHARCLCPSSSRFLLRARGFVTGRVTGSNSQNHWYHWLVTVLRLKTPIRHPPYPLKNFVGQLRSRAVASCEGECRTHPDLRPTAHWLPIT